MEIYDEDTLTPFEIGRQRNIIENYEFMSLCGMFFIKFDHYNIFIFSRRIMTMVA